MSCVWHRRRFNEFSGNDDRMNLLKVVYVHERISVEQNKVRDLTLLNGSEWLSSGSLWNQEPVMCINNSGSWRCAPLPLEQSRTSSENFLILLPPCFPCSPISESRAGGYVRAAGKGPIVFRNRISEWPATM